MNDIRLQMQNISSYEYYAKQDGAVEQIIKDISLRVNAGDILAILSASAFELRLLFEIMGNARPYEKGICVLNEMGMIRKKKINIAHVFYIGSTNMCLENMNTLEYLMYIQAKQQTNCISCQEDTLQFLIDVDMGYLALSEIRCMSSCEKSIVTICSALFTSAKLIILNIARVEYDQLATKALTSLCRQISSDNKSLIMASFDHKMINQCASHIGILKAGEIVGTLPKKQFVEAYDPDVCYLEVTEKSDAINLIKKHFPNLLIEVQEQGFKLKMKSDYKERAGLYQQLIQLFCEHNISPIMIKQHMPCVENAVKGCLK